MIAMLTYKILPIHQPTYLYNTLVSYHPAHTLRWFLTRNFFQIPYINTDSHQHSFNHHSSKIWNEITATTKAFYTAAALNVGLKLITSLASWPVTNTVHLGPTGECPPVRFQISSTTSAL